jgi:translocator protein
MMSSALVYTFLVCGLSVLLEGLFAGKGVKAYMERLRSPSYSLPVWAWFLLGGLYYVICFAVVYRILSRENSGILRTVVLVLILVVMGINALWNLFFFRMRSLSLSVVISIPYSLIAVALFICLLQFDRLAAWFLLPYMIYLIYANLWGYKLWKLNSQ